MKTPKYKAEKEYYDNYKWEKASYVTFISRIKNIKLPFEIAITAWNLKYNKDKIKKRRETYRSKQPYWEFYINYPWEKTNYRTFKDKIKAWLSPEEAILKFNKVKKNKKNSYYSEKRKSNFRKKQTTKTFNESYHFIEVTYSVEEANVIRTMYITKIQDDEIKLIGCSYDEAIKIQKEIDQLRKELEVFNKWNPL